MALSTQPAIIPHTTSDPIALISTVTQHEIIEEGRTITSVCSGVGLQEVTDALSEIRTICELYDKP